LHQCRTYDAAEALAAAASAGANQHQHQALPLSVPCVVHPSLLCVWEYDMLDYSIAQQDVYSKAARRAAASTGAYKKLFIVVVITQQSLLQLSHAN
jgi:hypothetical protein